MDRLGRMSAFALPFPSQMRWALQRPAQAGPNRAGIGLAESQRVSYPPPKSGWMCSWASRGSAGIKVRVEMLAPMDPSQRRNHAHMHSRSSHCLTPTSHRLRHTRQGRQGRPSRSCDDRRCALHPREYAVMRPLQAQAGGTTSSLIASDRSGRLIAPDHATDTGLGRVAPGTAPMLHGGR
jgi:hypothetical protein